MRVEWPRARRLVAVGFVAGSIGVLCVSLVTMAVDFDPVLAACKTLASSQAVTARRTRRIDRNLTLTSCPISARRRRTACLHSLG